MTPAVYSVQLDKRGVMTLNGMADAPVTQSDAAALLLKKRKSSETHIFPLDWTDEDNWTATVCSQDMALANGTWDVYIVWNETERQRLKTEDGLVIDENRTALLNQGQHTYEVQCYITTKGSLSLKIATPSMTVTQLNGEVIGDSTIRLTGYMREDASRTADLNEAALVVKQEHGEDALQTFPLHRFAEDQDRFYADISYQTMARDPETDKWDVYMRTGGYLFRVKLDDPGELERHTCLEWRDAELTLLYIYSTVYDNLSIKRTGLKIKRDVTSYTLSDDQLQLQGYAYFERLPFDIPDKLKRSIIIRQRQTGEELVYPLENRALADTADAYYQYAGFTVTVPLETIQAMQSDISHVYDISIRLVYGDHVQERGLGLEFYDYQVDKPLAASTSWQRTKGVRSFLTLTPAGNLKLDMYSYARRKLKYVQKLQTANRPAADDRPIWLIGERPDTAQDTGYHFFKYCREQFPDLPIYYVIAKDSPDRDHVRQLGHVITYGSMDHFRKTAAASTFIGSHDLEYILPTRAVDWPSYQHGTRVFLQHGVLGRKKVDYAKSDYQYPFHVFCVSSESEQNMVINQMGYQPEEVAITGLSRFDQLMEQPDTERSILLMPTWRDWIKENNFLESEYFHRYQALLTDSRLHAMLEKYDEHMDFYLHYRMQAYVSYFRELASDRMTIIAFDEADVQSLLLKNRLLITDYSSVSFDFNYMGKPVLFYQFDFERFFRKGLLRPAAETFLGEICYDQETLITAIEQHIQNGFEESPDAGKQKENLFDHIDQHNNERILNAIMDAKKTQNNGADTTGPHPAR
ncbi:hypothetical protein GCM10028778_15630 [Barrientosiimonas marina]|uniref:CDP-glycerol glycerophosphotransferase family protein n=1 Tax=Lentibacillus kimchii TaxID=1542911 RepID=A0ABW2UX94_9BACI